MTNSSNNNNGNNNCNTEALEWKTYDCREIAQAFIQRAKKDGKSFTQLKILKLVYLAHACMLYKFNKPLIHNTIEAWPYGPVIPDLYYTIRYNGKNAVNCVPGYENPDFDNFKYFSEEQQKTLNLTYKTFKDYSAIFLSNYTHAPQSTWYKIKNEKGVFAKMTDEDIKSCCIQAKGVF